MARWRDDQLITGIGMADAGEVGPSWGDSAQREAWIAAASDELANRLARRKAA